jgi:hypothetical protein
VSNYDCLNFEGGAVTCASLHLGEIQPGKFRGNHRHHDCNETFVLWGAAIKFRVRSPFNFSYYYKLFQAKECKSFD